MMLVKTFFETKLAVGRLGCIREKGNVRPTAPASVMTPYLHFLLTSNCDRDNNKQIDI